MTDPAPLMRGDVLVSPAGTEWTVVPGSRFSTVRGERKIRSAGGATRWVYPRDVQDWERKAV